MAAKAKIVRNAVDTWVDGRAGKQSKNYSNGAAIKVDADEALAFVYLSNPVPRGSKVTRATLRLYTSGSWGGASPTLSVKRVGGRYTNSRLTWNNRPSGTGATVTKTQASSGDGDEWAVNVAPLIQAVADGQPWYGFLVSISSATARDFRSAQANGKQPSLDVAWTEPVAVPTMLSPGGGQAVNAAKPVVEADYTDDSGTTALANVNVQVSASVTMSAPWDSGTVLTAGSKARLDLATTTYPGLAETGRAYWRIRVQDDAGEWSPFSAVATWVRTAKGAVTINSPSAVTPTLADFTPPVLWSFSKVQEKWQVLVRRTDTGVEVYDSGEQPGIETEATVVARNGSAVLAFGVPYEVEVRAWDDADRIGTTDDPPYSFATRAFTVQAGPVTAVTGVRFEQLLAPKVGLTLVFERDTAPDAFTITRDGVPVVTNVEPSDFERTGLTFRYPLTNVRPNVDNVLGVSAIVNGVASPLVTAIGRATISGIWLVEKDGSRAVMFAKTGGSKFDHGEEGETIVPLGATEGIRVTQSLRGYEGSVSGVLANIGGKTRDQWVDTFLAMRDNAGVERRLIVGTEVFDVVTWNMTVRPTGDSAPGMRPASFEFMQTSPRRVV